VCWYSRQIDKFTLLITKEGDSFMPCAALAAHTSQVVISNFQLFIAHIFHYHDRSHHITSPSPSLAVRRLYNEAMCHQNVVEIEGRSLLWWDYLEGGSKSMADCLDFDKNFELGKI
jgi:hypothetical protein